MESGIFGRKAKRHWRLEQDVCYLNNGSFGATPEPVLRRQAELRDRMEAQPVAFFLDFLPEELRRQAGYLAEFAGGEAHDYVFVENASCGVQSVLNSFLTAGGAAATSLKGREILSTNHVYGAVRHILQHSARHFGLGYREAVVPFPIESPGQVLQALDASLSGTTALLVIDHISSSTGLVFPLPEIIAMAKSRGVPVLVDGAHAPGMLPLDIPSLGADWYVGNCHKWLFAPKGCALLWCAPQWHQHMHPSVISNFFGEGYTAEFDYVGTRDYTPWLCLSAALKFARDLGLDAMRSYQRSTVLAARDVLCDTLAIQPPAPDEMIASMVALPWSRPRHARQQAQDIRRHLWQSARIELPFFDFEDDCLLRISAQVFNEAADYRRLAEALPLLDQSLRN